MSEAKRREPGTRRRSQPPCQHCGGEVEEYMPGMFYQGWKCVQCQKLTWTPQEWTTQPSPVEQMQNRIAQLEEALRPFAQFADTHFRGLDQKVNIPVWTSWLAEAQAALSSSTSEAKGDTSE